MILYTSANIRVAPRGEDCILRRRFGCNPQVKVEGKGGGIERGIVSLISSRSVPPKSYGVGMCTAGLPVAVLPSWQLAHPLVMPV